MKGFGATPKGVGKIPTAEAFSQAVITLSQTLDISYFDAVRHVCDHYDRDYESVKELLTSQLIQMLTIEQSALHTIKPKARVVGLL